MLPLSPMSIVSEQEHYQDLWRECDHERLAQLARTGASRYYVRYQARYRARYQAMAWLGQELVALGQGLQRMVRHAMARRLSHKILRVGEPSTRLNR